MLTSTVVVIAHLIGLPYWWEKSPVMLVFLVIFGYWLLTNVTFHYIMAVYTPPGHPPDVSLRAKQWEYSLNLIFNSLADSFEFISQKDLYEAVSICKKCLTPKPTRTHHCSICNKCVLKMDHHCRMCYFISVKKREKIKFGKN